MSYSPTKKEYLDPNKPASHLTAREEIASRIFAVLCRDLYLDRDQVSSAAKSAVERTDILIQALNAKPCNLKNPRDVKISRPVRNLFDTTNAPLTTLQQSVDRWIKLDHAQKAKACGLNESVSSGELDFITAELLNLMQDYGGHVKLTELL